VEFATAGEPQKLQCWQMKNKYDQFESEMIEAYENGEFISTYPSKAELEKFRSAAVYRK
jgi:hypothetical protein